jgi:hypothetical protein
MWTARTIIKQLAGDLRRPILSAFWQYAEPDSRRVAEGELARTLHYRPQKLRKLPADKKAGLLATRLNAPEYEQIFELALMQYLTNVRTEMLGAFLDEWKIPHQDGTIEDDEVTAPSVEQVRAAAKALEGRFEADEVILYLATAGLLMGEDWAATTWPVVEELTNT